MGLDLQSKADAFEYADQVLERWYPTLEEGNNKGIVVLVTSQKEGAVTGGPEFIKAVGDTVLDATVSQNLPGNSLSSHLMFNMLHNVHLYSMCIVIHMSRPTFAHSFDYLVNKRRCKLLII